MAAADPAPGVTATGRMPVLIVTMGTDYVAPARMPRELARAGFAVTVLAPSGALATKTAHADAIATFPRHASVYEWMHVVAGAVRRTAPSLVLPGDDVTLRLLMQLVLERPRELRTDAMDGLAAVVARSLGDPARYVASVDKSVLVPLAAAAGIPVPPGEAVDDEPDAVRAAAALGYPVIVRPAVGTASAGVARCHDEAALRHAMRNLPPLSGWRPGGGRRVLVQRLLSGRPANHPAVAWQGREVAGFTRVAVRQHPEAGPGSVSSYAPHPEIAATNARLIEALGVTGFASTEYLIDSVTGVAHLIEINRRMTPATHTGAQVGVNLAAALAAACAGRPWEGPADIPAGVDRTLALFPQEWLRDPGSPHLSGTPTDAPWDDPLLFAALLKLGLGLGP